MRLFFAGTFNPFTTGHADLVGRALAMGASVVIGLGRNADKPGSAEAAEAEAGRLRALYAGEPRVEVTVYDGLTAEAARRAGADALLRGVRSAADFDYENTLAQANRATFGIDTLLLAADPALAWVSSTVVRDLRRHGHDVTNLIPQP